MSKKRKDGRTKKTIEAWIQIDIYLRHGFIAEVELLMEGIMWIWRVDYQKLPFRWH